MKEIITILGLLILFPLLAKEVTSEELADSYDSFLRCMKMEDNLIFRNKILERDILVGIKQFSKNNIKLRNGAEQIYKSFEVLDKELLEVDVYKTCLTKDKIVTLNPNYHLDDNVVGCDFWVPRGVLSRKDLTGEIGTRYSQLRCEVISKEMYLTGLKRLSKIHKDNLKKNKL